MNPMISVIIPAYNAEDTVKKTVESALKQSFGDYEVIVINDGSEDGTLSLLENIKQEFPELILITRPHAGAAAARNAGIETAKGEYLYFADADDLMHENAIETMYRAVKDTPCDLLTFGFKKINKKKNAEEEVASAFCNMDGAAVRADFTSYGEKGAVKVIGSCWNKLFRKQIILDKGIRFPEELSRNEEEVFIMRYLEHTASICNIPDVLYDFYPIDMEKAQRIMKADFTSDVEQFRKIRLDFATRFHCVDDKTKNFIASEYWGKMMLSLRLDKKRGDLDHFKNDAALLMQGLKETGTVPANIKKSKTYLLLKMHLVKQVYSSL